MSSSPKGVMGPEHKSADAIADIATGVMEDMKAAEVVRLDVRHLTSLMDYMIVASGRSDRHVRAIADALVERCKSDGVPVASVEGQASGEWILVDLIDVVVHVMLPKVRDFYELEKLWKIARPEDDADRARLHIR